MSVISDGDAAPVFKSPEEPLDHISTTIDAPVERIWRPARSGSRDDGLDVSLCQPVAQAVCVIGFVGEQAPGRSDRTEQRDGNGDVSDIARRQGDSNRSAAIIGQAVDLARPAASRAANRFFMLPLLSRCRTMCFDVAPASRLQHVQDARDHRSIVNPRLPRLTRKMRLDRCPCLIRQPNRWRDISSPA